VTPVLFALSGPKVEADVLAIALNVYATTSSLGGSAGTAYGFTVDAYGLEARSFTSAATGPPSASRITRR
jgi:hypothetical protein